MKGKRNKVDPTLRDMQKNQAMMKRDKYDNNNMGRFVKIYPKNEKAEKKYEKFMKESLNVWEEFTTGNKFKKRKAEIEKIEQ